MSLQRIFKYFSIGDVISLCSVLVIIGILWARKDDKANLALSQNMLQNTLIQRNYEDLRELKSDITDRLDRFEGKLDKLIDNKVND